MPRVKFLYDNIVTEVSEGTKIIEVVEKTGATVPFGCKMGSCGSCRCLIKEGGDNLNPITEAEQDLFENLTSVGREERLACQLVVFGDVSIQC